MGNNSSTDRSSLTKGEQSFLDAASAGDLEAVKRFCENLPPGASSAAELINNIHDSYNMSALHNAADRDRRAVVEYLLQQGANIDALTTFANTPLHCALRSGHDECGVLLLNHYLQWSRVRLIFIGHRKGRLDGSGCPFGLIPNDLCKIIARYVQSSSVSEKPSINSRNRDYHRPIDLCARQDLPRSTKLLLQCGVDPSERNLSYSGYTPLHHCAVRGSVEVAKILLAAGVSPAIKNARGETVLYRGCCSVDDNASVIQLLLDAGADPTETVKGSTALMEAQARNHSRTVALLESAIEMKNSTR